MSQTGTVSKLEALLARIRTRAAAPRPEARALAGAPAGATPAGAAPAAPAAPAPAPVAAAAPAPAPVAAHPAPAPATTPTPAPVVVEPVTVPPPPVAASDSDIAVDIDVTDVGQSLPPPEVEVDAPAAAESVERWVAAPSVPPESSRDQVRDVTSVAPSEDVDALLESSVSVRAPDLDVPEAPESGETGGAEEPPASSRRPVVSAPEQLADMAFGAEEEVPLPPPRHTPPPKSGRLPAPIAELETDFIGARGAGSPSNDDHTQPSARPPTATVLVAQPVRPNLAAATGPVVDVIALASRFAPRSFAELLDASLEL